MKRVYVIVIALLMIVSIFLQSACDTEYVPAYVDVSIVKQPVGGYNINSLSSSYNARLRYEPNEETKNRAIKGNVTVTAVWINDKGAEYSEQKITLGETATGGTFTISAAPKTAGQYFDKTFWVRITWDDHNGSHTVTSSKAVCLVK